MRLSHIKHYVHIILLGLENQVTSTCKYHTLCPLISFSFLSYNIYVEASSKTCFCVFPPSIARTPNALPKKRGKKTKEHSAPLQTTTAPLHFLCSWLSSIQTWPVQLAFWRAPGYAEAGVCCLVCAPPELHQ